VLALADLGNIFAEFAGIASGMGIFGVSKYIAVPIGAALVWYVIVKGSYKPVERILILFSLIYFAYPVSAFFANPDWHTALVKTFVPEFRSDSAYITMMVGLVGTTITPWMQFYLQASMVEKGVSKRDYRLARWDVVLGCIVTDALHVPDCIGCRSRPHPEHAVIEGDLALSGG
jgi:Mn2+/Fe2+ NRAMP family transporter